MNEWKKERKKDMKISRAKERRSCGQKSMYSKEFEKSTTKKICAKKENKICFKIESVIESELLGR